MFNIFGAIQASMARALQSQEVREGDWYNEDGLLVCGTCGKMRQKYRAFPNPCDGYPNRTTEIKVVCDCDCDIAAEERERIKKENEEWADRLARLRSASLMDKKYEKASLDTYTVTKENYRILQAAKRYCEHFQSEYENGHGLLFYGGVGTGKTHTAACIANELMANGYPVIMTSFVKILDELKRNKDYDIVGILSNAKLIVIDDLGAERSTEYAQEQVYNIVDSITRKQIPMILTTNISADDMREEPDIQKQRIYDRIFECCTPVRFSGESFRKSAGAAETERFREMVTK